MVVRNYNGRRRNEDRADHAAFNTTLEFIAGSIDEIKEKINGFTDVLTKTNLDVNTLQQKLQSVERIVYGTITIVVGIVVKIIFF